MSTGVIWPTYLGAVQGLWHLEGDFADSSVNGYTLTATGSPDDVIGKFGNAKLFNAADTDSAITATATNLRIAGNQTFMCWYKPNSTNATRRLMVLSDNGPTNFIGMTFDSTTITFEISGLTPSSISSPLAAKNGVWHFTAGVYNATDAYVALFVNGIYNLLPVTGSHTAGTGELALGKFGAATSGVSADGIIEEVAVFSKALSLKELNDYYSWALGRKSFIA